MQRVQELLGDLGVKIHQKWETGEQKSSESRNKFVKVHWYRRMGKLSEKVKSANFKCEEYFFSSSIFGQWLGLRFDTMASNSVLSSSESFNEEKGHSWVKGHHQLDAFPLNLVSGFSFFSFNQKSFYFFDAQSSLIEEPFTQWLIFSQPPSSVQSLWPDSHFIHSDIRI